MDNEVNGGGNEYDYGMRIYNPRIGKFLSVDPISKSYPFYSPYAFAGNTPIQAIDIDGLEPGKIEPGTKNLIIFVNGFTENPEKGKTQAPEDLTGLGIASSLLKNQNASQVFTYSSHRGDVTKDDIISTIKTFRKQNPDGKVILVGHSQGGDNIIELAKENPDITIDLMIPVDANDGSNAFVFNVPDDNINGNVKNVINYHQKTEILCGVTIDDDDIKDKKKTKYADILVPGSVHTSIDEDVAPYIFIDIIFYIMGGDAVENAKNRKMPTFKPDTEKNPTSSKIVTKKYLSGSKSSSKGSSSKTSKTQKAPVKRG